MPAWTPTLISPHTWIDFSDTATLFDATSGGSVVTNGVGIARAEDKSGNGRHFTQSTAGNRFTWTSGVQNALGVARADGGDWLTSISARSVWRFLHNAPSTIFVVTKNGTSSNPVALCSWFGNNGGSSANTGVYFAYDDRAVITGLTDALNCLCSGAGDGAYGAVAIGGASIVTEFRNVITPNAFGAFTLRSDPTNATLSSRIKLAVNGGLLVGNNERLWSVSSSDASFDLQIGTLGNSSVPFLGDYGELLIFNSLLSTTNQQLVEGYLAWKWGIQADLPSGHPYKNAAPFYGSDRRRRYSGRAGL